MTTKVITPVVVADPPGDPDRAIVIVDNDATYKLNQSEWQKPEYASTLSNVDKGIVNQLGLFGSLVACVRMADGGVNTFLNQRAILAGAGISPEAPKPTTTQGVSRSTPGGKRITVLGDDGITYSLGESDWEQFPLSSESGAQNIADRLESLGSYVAFVRKDLALQVGCCCIVLNLRSLVQGTEGNPQQSTTVPLSDYQDPSASARKAQ